jgi:outer membrane receptor protein involved in Fe transport
LNFLNPNINAANPQQVSQGNPLLEPELTDNYEMSYSTFFKGSNLNFTTYFRNTTGSIQPVRTVRQDDIIFTTFENIGQEKAYGLSVFANVNLSGKFSVNGSVEGYFAQLDNGLTDPLYAASNDGFVFSGRIFANYSLPKDWQVQAFTFQRGRRVELQGTSGGFGVYGLNFNKSFNEKKVIYNQKKELHLINEVVNFEDFDAYSIKKRNNELVNYIIENNLLKL